MNATSVSKAASPSTVAAADFFLQSWNFWAEVSQSKAWNSSISKDRAALI